MQCLQFIYLLIYLHTFLLLKTKSILVTLLNKWVLGRFYELSFSSVFSYVLGIMLMNMSVNDSSCLVFEIQFRKLGRLQTVLMLSTRKIFPNENGRHFQFAKKSPLVLPT